VPISCIAPMGGFLRCNDVQNCPGVLSEENAFAIFELQGH